VSTARGPVLTAGVFLGVGLGAFLDGIALHQLLQWHNMLSSVIVPADLISAKVNMFWDGLFHAFAWLTTVVGVALLWRAARDEGAQRSGRLLVSGLLVGWGLFNLIEGLVDHELLGIHHVRPGGDQLAWDLGFLAFGAVLFGLGWRLGLPRALPRPRPARA
jgi:uncharacterized membrane protein